MYSELFSTDNLSDFWPSAGRTYLENTNATIRFILYTSVAVYLLTGDYRVVYLGLIIICFLLYSLDSKGVSYFKDEEDYKEPIVTGERTHWGRQRRTTEPEVLNQKQQSALDRTILVPLYDPHNFMHTAFPTIVKDNGGMGRSVGDPNARGPGNVQGRAAHGGSV